MTLKQLLSTLTTSKLLITVKDAAGEIITFYSDGWEGVEEDILARNVTDWSVSQQRVVTIGLDGSGKAAGTITLAVNTATMESVGATYEVAVTENSGVVTATSSDEDVVTAFVDNSGSNPVVRLTEVGAGEATVTVTASESATTQAASATIAVTCTAD